MLLSASTPAAFTLGAGVVPYATPPGHVRALRNAIEADGRY